MFFLYLAGRRFSWRANDLGANFALTPGTFCFDRNILIFADGHLWNKHV